MKTSSRCPGRASASRWSTRPARSSPPLACRSRSSRATDDQLTPDGRCRARPSARAAKADAVALRRRRARDDRGSRVAPLGDGAWGGVRPSKFYTGMRSPLSRSEGIDFVVIRENSEDLYPGARATLADAKRALPNLRDRFGRGLDRYGEGHVTPSRWSRARVPSASPGLPAGGAPPQGRGHPGKSRASPVQCAP